MASRPALVLDDPSLASEEVRVFANFPGRWASGEPVAVAELGFVTDEEAYARVDELGLPLARTSVDEGDGYLRLPDNHALNDEQLRAAERTGDELLLEGAPAEDQPADVLLERKASEVVDEVAAVDDVDVLDGLEQAETVGKNRSTVLQAIAERREALAAAHGVEA